MNHSGIIHKMNETFQYKLREHEYIIKLITGKDDLKEVKIGYLEKYFREKHMPVLSMDDFILPMEKVASTMDHDYYEVTVSDEILLTRVHERIQEARTHTDNPFFQKMLNDMERLENTKITMLSLAYYFILDDGKGIKYYGNYKFFDERPYDVLDMFNMVIYQTDSIYFETPAWSKGAIIYQIFPERFAAKGDSYSENWFTVPMQGKLRTNGSLEGIREKIPYLKEVGIDAIYMTPIFLSKSSHRYDTIDYMKIDPPLGTEEDFKNLVDDCHKAGIKVILDLVFNHSSTDFFAFQDLLKNQEKSIYKDWYFIKKFPVQMKMPSDYMGFSFSPGMPKLNTSNKECRKYLMDVSAHYLKTYDIDGYRLDVANEVTHDFWREFRKLCKGIKKDCLIMGEIWYDSSMYLRGDEFDSVMNYTYFDAIRGLLQNKFSLSEFKSILERERGEGSLCCYHNSNILVGSHDTERIYHALDHNIRKYKMAMALLFTLPGSPILYYGDEKMMDGAMDPDCRRGMIFDKEYNKESFSYVKKLISIHHKDEFRMGDLKIIPEDSYLAFFRVFENKKVLVLMNPKDIEVSTEYKGIKNLLDDNEFDGILKPYMCVISEI